MSIEERYLIKCDTCHQKLGTYGVPDTFKTKEEALNEAQAEGWKRRRVSIPVRVIPPDEPVDWNAVVSFAPCRIVPVPQGLEVTYTPPTLDLCNNCEGHIGGLDFKYWPEEVRKRALKGIGDSSD